MKVQLNGELGNISISKDVVAAIAGSASMECFGVVGMAAVNIRDGFVRLLKKDSLKRGIEVAVNDINEIFLKIHVIVAYGVNIFTVSNNLIDTVKYRIEEHTGLKVGGIDIYVEGVRRID